MGEGRSAQLQEHQGDLVAMSFRRPIIRDHVEQGCLIRENLITREGTKRVATIVLDEASARAAYILLKAWHEDRKRTVFIVSVLSRIMSKKQRRFSFFRRLFQE